MLFMLLIIITLIDPGMWESNYEETNEFNEMLEMIAFIYLVAYLVCLYFLYKFKPFGKQFFLFLFVIGSILSLLIPGGIVTPVDYVIDGLSWANAGVLLTLLYFSPIKKEFDK